MRRAFLLPSSACSSSSVLSSSSSHRRLLLVLRRAASSTSTRTEEEVGLSQSPAADADTATIEPDSDSSTQPGWNLFPEDIVAHLDKYIVSQGDAKKATAIAMRMRWRRNQLPDEIRAEVTPSNILMKGPTGTGKTEIARRLSTLAEAPFIKVEATRYTEVVSTITRKSRPFLFLHSNRTTFTSFVSLPLPPSPPPLIIGRGRWKQGREGVLALCLQTCNQETHFDAFLSYFCLRDLWAPTLAT